MASHVNNIISFGFIINYLLLRVSYYVLNEIRICALTSVIAGVLHGPVRKRVECSVVVWSGGKILKGNELFGPVPHTIRSGSMRKVTNVTRPIRVIIVMRILQDCYVG